MEGVCRVCCWWLVYSLTWPESDWLDSGWVGLHTWGAWAIMAPQDKPAINTHTRGGATVMTSLPSARRIPTACKLQINILYYIYPCPVSEEPKESHFGGVWRSNPATTPNWAFSSQGKVYHIWMLLNGCLHTPTYCFGYNSHSKAKKINLLKLVCLYSHSHHGSLIRKCLKTGSVEDEIIAYYQEYQYTSTTHCGRGP